MAEKKTPAKKRAVKGDAYVCEVCGLAVIVDEACSCGSCEILCCDKPMKAQETKAKAAKK